jgi:hypothetical protein
MELFRYIAYVLYFFITVLTTLDFIVDSIEVMSGRSIDHLILNEKTIDYRYMFIVAIMWTIHIL